MANDITTWHKASNNTGRYAAGYFIGSTGENGEHLRRRHEGWPFSVYIRAKEVGVTDAVVCHGIQNIGDAERICYLLNQHYTFGEC